MSVSLNAPLRILMRSVQPQEDGGTLPPLSTRRVAGRARRFADLCGLMFLSARGRACETGRYVQREYGTDSGRSRSNCGGAQRNWWKRSKGKIRADVAHEKITAMGYMRSERATGAGSGQIKTAYAHCSAGVSAGSPGLGMWAQYDFADGRGSTAANSLGCFWLSWSPFRVVLPLLDKSGCWPIWRCARPGGHVSADRYENM
jgi:hypothetical protein